MRLMAVLLLGLAACKSSMPAPPPDMQRQHAAKSLMNVARILKLRGGGDEGMGGVSEFSCNHKASYPGFEEDVAYPQPFYRGVEEETEERAPLRVQTLHLDITDSDMDCQTLEGNLVSPEEFFNASAVPERAHQKRQQIFCPKLENPFADIKPPDIDPEDEFDFAYNKDSDEISHTRESRGGVKEEHLPAGDHKAHSKDEELVDNTSFHTNNQEFENLQPSPCETTHGDGQQECAGHTHEREDAIRIDASKLSTDEMRQHLSSESKFCERHPPEAQNANEEAKSPSRFLDESKFDEFLKKHGLKREMTFRVQREEFPDSILQEENEQLKDFVEVMRANYAMPGETDPEKNPPELRSQESFTEKVENFHLPQRFEVNGTNQTSFSSAAVSTIPSKTGSSRLQVKELVENLRKYYLVFNASKVESAEQIASIFVHKMDQLDEMLLDKYGVSLTDFMNEDDSQAKNATMNEQQAQGSKASDKTNRMLAEAYIEGKELEKTASREQQQIEKEMWDIHRANMDKIKSMSQNEIDQAKEQISHNLSPEMIQLLEKRARKRLQNIKNMTIDDQPKEQLAADEERREELEKELGPLFQIGASPDGPWSTDEDGTRRTTLVKEQEAEVARMYEGVLNINPNDFAMIMKYARFEKEERHMMRHAIDLFEDALRLIPNDVEALSEYGELMNEFRRKPAESQEIFEAVLDQNPSHCMTLVRYGNLCLNDFKDFKAAYGLYHSALQADPKNHRAHYGMAYLHQQLGNRTKAAHHYELSLTLNPSFFPTLGNYASMLYLDHVDKRMGKKITDDIKRAAKLYETATLLQPSNTANLLNYGMLLENVFGEEVKAEFLYRTALTLEETNCDAICMLSKLIFKGKEDVGEVQSLLYQALETNPSHVQTLLRLGELYHNHLTNMSNHKIQAKEFYESALQLDPNNVDVLNSLATLYAEMDSSDLNYTCSAEDCLMKAYELAPTDPDTVLNIGSYMMDSKQDMPTAKRLFRQALKLQPDHPGALCYNALAEALTGRNFTLAYFLMDRARALAPNEIHIQEALLSLDTLAMKERWDPTSSSKNNPPSLYVASIPVSGKSKSDPSSSGNQTSSSQGKGKAENKSEEKLEFEGPRRGYYYEELGNLRQIPSDIPDGSDLTDPRHEWNQF